MRLRVVGLRIGRIKAWLIAWIRELLGVMLRLGVSLRAGSRRVARVMLGLLGFSPLILGGGVLVIVARVLLGLGLVVLPLRVSRSPDKACSVGEV